MSAIVLDGPVGAEVRVDGRTCIYFGGNDYLGMAAHPEVARGAKAAVDEFGLSSSASRLTTGTTRLHLRLEAVLSAFAGTEDATVVASGYFAMRCLLEAVYEESDCVLLQRSAHASIRDAVRLTAGSFEEFDPAEPLQTAAAVERLSSTGRRLLVVAEGIGPLSGYVFPLPQVLGLLEGTDALVLLDDAHAFGVAGPGGRGTSELFGLQSDLRVLACATLSKAFGAFGGCVPASRALADRLRERSLTYACATPASAADLGGALAALELVRREPEIIGRLHRNVSALKAGLASLGLPVDDTLIPIIPITRTGPGEMERLSRRLLDRGILTPYINYPGSPPGGVIRLTARACHTDAHIDQLLSALQNEC